VGRNRFRKILLVCGEGGRLAGDRVVDVRDPDGLIPDDDEARHPDGWGLILRICLLLFPGLIFWQAVLVPWKP